MTGLGQRRLRIYYLIERTALAYIGGFVPLMTGPAGLNMSISGCAPLRAK